MTRRSACIAAALLVCGAGNLVHAQTEIRVLAQDGSFFGTGGEFVLSGTNGTFEFSSGNPAAVDITFIGESSDWYFTFATADQLQALAVGRYENAGRFEEGVPNYSIVGAGSNCQNPSGYFEIYDIGFDVDGNLARLAVDAVMRCNANPPPTRWQVRHNTGVPFDLGAHVTADDDRVVPPGSQVTVGLKDVRTSNNSIVSYEWTQVFGNPLALSGTATDTLTFQAPVADAEYEVYEFQVTVTDDAGAVASDTVTVISSENTAVDSRYLILTTPTGYIGGTEDVEAAVDPQYLSFSRHFGRINVTYRLPDNSGWTLDLWPANGEDAGLGQYDMAFGLTGGPQDKPAVDFGLLGRSCGDSLGEFKVLDIGFSEYSQIDRLAVDVQMSCANPGRDPVEMRFRHNTVVPIYSRAPIADPGPDLIKRTGEVVVLDGRSTQNDSGSIAEYRWEQVAGEPVSLSMSDSALASFVAPEVNPGDGYAEFALTVTNDSGLADTETVAVTILGSQDPKTWVKMAANPEFGREYITRPYSGELLFDPNNGYFSSRSQGAAAYINFDQFGRWSFAFANNPDGSASQPDLPPGLYEYAGRNVGGRPFMDISGENRGCSRPAGKFVVHEFVAGAEGTPLSAAIDFEQTCDFSGLLEGRLRFNSKLPEDVPGLYASAGRDQQAVPGDVVTLDAGNSYIGPTDGVTYLWEQVSGPGVDLVDANRQKAQFEAPAAAGEAVFRVTMMTAEGLTSTASVTVSFVGPGVPVSAVYVNSEPGSNFLNGRSVYFDTLPAYMSYAGDALEMIDSSGGRYVLSLASGDGSTLAPGDYLGAHRFAEIPGFPGLDFEYNYTGCPRTLGWYRIHEIETSNIYPQIARLAVDFWQACEPGAPGQFGTVRINSAVPSRPDLPIATAGRNLTGRSGTDLAISAEQSFSMASPVIAYSWKQLSGPPATFLTSSAVADPVITLPGIGSGTDKLEFEVTVLTAAGTQSSASTNVTVLGPGQPWHAFDITLVDLETGEIIQSVSATPNDSDFDLVHENDVTRLILTHRDLFVRFNFGTTLGQTDIVEGPYYRDDDRDTNFPLLDVYQGIGFFCGGNQPGWLHVRDLDVAGGTSSMSIETFRECGDIGARVSARLNSADDIDRDELVIVAGANRSVTEGDTVRVDDFVAYVEGALAGSVRWEVVNGPAVTLAEMQNARTMFMAPATVGNSTLDMRLTLESRDGRSVSRDVRFNVVDNGIEGFPHNLVTARTRQGPLNASGRPVAFASDHLVSFYPGSFDAFPAPLSPVSAPYGRLEMEFATAPAESIAVTIYFDVALDLDAAWLAKYPGESWAEFSEPWSLAADGSSLTFQITDGGLMDRDGKTNGRIWFSGGVGQTTVIAAPSPPPAPPPPRSSSGGGGGGTTGLPMLFALFAAALRRSTLGSRSPRPRELAGQTL